MKNIPLKTLVLASFFLLCSVWAGVPLYAQNNTSDSPIHEMPDADTCSVEMMHIRDLAASLKQVAREISLLEPGAGSTTEGHSMGEQQKNPNDLNALKEKEYSLRQKMYIQEQQLEECMKQDSPPKE